MVARNRDGVSFSAIGIKPTRHGPKNRRSILLPILSLLKTYGKKEPLWRYDGVGANIPYALSAPRYKKKIRLEPTTNPAKQYEKDFVG